jgi:hypothetical protein
VSVSFITNFSQVFFSSYSSSPCLTIINLEGKNKFTNFQDLSHFGRKKLPFGSPLNLRFGTDCGTFRLLESSLGLTSKFEMLFHLKS